MMSHQSSMALGVRFSVRSEVHDQPPVCRADSLEKGELAVSRKLLVIPLDMYES